MSYYLDTHQNAHKVFSPILQNETKLGDVKNFSDSPLISHFIKMPLAHLELLDGDRQTWRR